MFTIAVVVIVIAADAYQDIIVVFFNDKRCALTTLIKFSNIKIIISQVKISFNYFIKQKIY